MADKKVIDVTALREDERCDLARLLFKCGYGVEPHKEKTGNKYKHQIVIEKAGEK